MWFSVCVCVVEKYLKRLINQWHLDFDLNFVFLDSTPVCVGVGHFCFYSWNFRISNSHSHSSSCCSFHFSQKKKLKIQESNKLFNITETKTDHSIWWRPFSAICVMMKELIWASSPSLVTIFHLKSTNRTPTQKTLEFIWIFLWLIPAYMRLILPLTPFEDKWKWKNKSKLTIVNV